MDRRAVRLIIRGRVQGVGYRWWAMQHARRLGLDGWVRNRLDGSVELAAAGPSAAVEQLIAACHRGPAAAAVESVETFDAAEETGQGFRQRPTA